MAHTGGFALYLHYFGTILGNYGRGEGGGGVSDFLGIRMDFQENLGIRSEFGITLKQFKEDNKHFQNASE